MQGLNTTKKQITPYGRWQEAEGIPVMRGLSIPSLYGDLPMGNWPRKGVNGAFINLEGSQEAMDAYVLDIPQAGKTNPDRYVFEEEIFVVQGRGATTIWTDGGKKHTFEWQEGSVFSPPINTWRQHFNGSPDMPARLLAVSNAPVMLNLFQGPDFVFNCDHIFRERYSGEGDYFASGGKFLTSHVWQANFVSDIYSFALKEYNERGAGGTTIRFDMAGNTIRSHIAEFPVGTYKKAHRHGPAAHIIILSGQGFSLMWKEGEPKQKIDWQKGSLLVPPDMWFHQHFNAGKEPARYFAVHWGGSFRILLGERYTGGNNISVKLGGNQIEYKDEDPDILETFEAELKMNGLEPKQMDTWRR